jgi:hypothetical protein
MHPKVFTPMQKYRLDGRKGAFSRGKGLCKGHKKRCKGHVQGPQIRQIEMGARATWICARATRRGARASDVCKGHIFCLYAKILMINSIIWCKGLNWRCKGLSCVQGPHILPFYLISNDNQCRESSLLLGTLLLRKKVYKSKVWVPESNRCPFWLSI